MADAGEFALKKCATDLVVVRGFLPLELFLAKSAKAQDPSESQRKLGVLILKCKQPLAQKPQILGAHGSASEPASKSCRASLGY